MQRKLPLWSGIIVGSYFLIGLIYLATTNNDDSILFYPVNRLGEWIFERPGLTNYLNQILTINQAFGFIFAIAIIAAICLGPGAFAALVAIAICKLMRPKRHHRHD